MVPQPNLVLFARYPEPGACKTRLIPEYGAERAADVHRRLTERTVSILVQTNCPVTVATTGAKTEAFASWLGGGISLIAQAKGDLSDRLNALVALAPVIFFGADTPDLTIDIVTAAIEGLETHRVVIGPAEDGGYYLIGTRDPLPELFADIPWSTPEVLTDTLCRLDRLAIEPLLLETLADCDRPEDLARWPHLVT